MEFAGGVSALVGPNGSGKSNIVDAIKWVLGEQSVKKLRGSEMTDVIFSGSAGRAPLGAAEVTLSFDNSRRSFEIETAEVHITRRIYRSGEGEYLINRRPSRLKDIKELLSGTGLGTQAYSIIEQGRVESLLQSSGLQRRTIFEEAAGVSRFNAKKLEVARRLERVEQNMLRLADIVAEVENQLKTSKAQAGKAQQYRQYTEQLKSLRTESGLIDWRARAERCACLRSEIDDLANDEQTRAVSVERFEETLKTQNGEIERLDQEIRRLEGETAAVRERILGEESTIELQQAQIGELEVEIARHGRQLIELSTKNIDSEEMMRKSVEETERARTAFESTSASYASSVEAAETVAREAAKMKAQRESTARSLEQENRQNSRLGGEIGGLQSRLETLDAARIKNAQRVAQFDVKSAELAGHYDSLKALIDDLQIKVAERQKQLETAKRQKESRQAELETLTREFSQRKQKQSGLTERIVLIEELLRKHEGLSPGVREVIRLSRNPESPFRFTHGLVADILRVDVEAAALIELALGPKAQQIVVSPEPELFRHIEHHSSQFAGRVGFIWLDPHPGDETWNKTPGGFLGRNGVHGRADQFVNTDPAYAHLAHRLLGRTWIVESLAVAKRLYKESDDRTHFLTISGELLEADGTLVVGPPHGASGLITRRSELRTLREQLAHLETSIGQLDVDMAVVRNRLNEDERLLEEATREHQRMLTETQAQRHKIALAEERQIQTRTQAEHLVEEGRALEKQIAAFREELDAIRRKGGELESSIKNNETILADQTAAFERLEQERREHARIVTNARIEMAKCEERLDFLKDRIRQFEEHQKERKHLLADHRARLTALKKRRDAAEVSILHDEAAIALMYVLKEERSRESKTALLRRRDLGRNRESAQAELKRDQSILNQNRTQLHACQIELERLFQEQKTLNERMREDYGIDLAELEAENRGKDAAFRIVSADSRSGDASDGNTDPEYVGQGQAEQAQKEYRKEIESLRAKIARLGHVNLEAIETLEGLETRFTTLSNQLGDLRNAKKSIEKIIEKLNHDSQTLFEETFDGVREHFRELFQQLFGGGHADLIFEDETNPLESGIDIVARPPGKELKSVTLLSGGEKTLTCVALLLAFFRFRPNPVCILDECDAALDEGNIDRFIRVIKNFQAATQFLIITHSKKTMACATTMYGVTMQESGVSVPISVRFVDVGENGEILNGAGLDPIRPPQPDAGAPTFSVDTDSRDAA